MNAVRGRTVFNCAKGATINHEILCAHNPLMCACVHCKVTPSIVHFNESPVGADAQVHTNTLLPCCRAASRGSIGERDSSLFYLQLLLRCYFFAVVDAVASQASSSSSLCADLFCQANYKVTVDECRVLKLYLYVGETGRKGLLLRLVVVAIRSLLAARGRDAYPRRKSATTFHTINKHINITQPASSVNVNTSVAAAAAEISLLIVSDTGL